MHSSSSSSTIISPTLFLSSDVKSKKKSTVRQKEQNFHLPSSSSRERKKSSHFKKPHLATSIDRPEAMLPHQNRPPPPPPDLKSLSLSVSFKGWRLPNRKFKSWATKISSLHKPTWIQAGVFEAIMASTKGFVKTQISFWVSLRNGVQTPTLFSSLGVKQP